jgi:hypothetical protein
MGEELTMTTAAMSNQSRSPALPLELDSRTLVGEHALLLRDVRRRTAPVLALAGIYTWPAEELRTLIGFLRTAVPRQVSDEERWLFPDDFTTASFAELSNDHLRLHTLTEQLAQAFIEPCALSELVALIDELLTTLERHLTEEQAVLAALSGVPEVFPSTAEFADDRPSWSPAAGGARILLDTLPSERAVSLSIERLLRMRPGESAEVHSSDAATLGQLWDWMRCYDTAGYGFSRTQTGPRQWCLQITRRHPA